MQHHLSIRIDEDNPTHHLWNNGGSWWIHYTVHTDDGRKRRVRYSLKTTRLDYARVLRDAIFALWTGPDRPVEEVLRRLLENPPPFPHASEE